MQLFHVFDLTVDYSQLRPKMIDYDTFTMALNGTFMNPQLPGPVSQPIIYDPTWLNGKDFRVFFTDYILNSLFEVGFHTYSTLDVAYLFQKHLHQNITTDLIGMVIPEVV